MALVLPSTVSNPTTGQPILAAWGDAVNDVAAYLSTNKPHARAYNSGAFAHTSSGSAVAVTFDSENFDVGGCHSTSSNTARLTVPSGEGGKYEYGGGGTWASHATGVRYFQFRINGTTTLPETWRNESATDTTPAGTVGGMYALAAGDYLELMAFQNSGGNLNISSTFAWIRWVAA